MLKNILRQLFFLMANVVCCTVAQAAPPAGYAPLPETIQKISSNIGELRQRAHNIEVEVSQVEHRFDNLELIVNGLRNQMEDFAKVYKDQADVAKVTLESRIGNLEHTSTRVFSDLQLVKNHVNDFSGVISQYKQQLQVLEQNSKLQNQNIENLQTALKVLTEALRVGEDQEIAPNEYKVKAGDSLEKIAQTHGTTVKAIKELNDLTSDRIRINLKLKLPEK